MNNPAAMTQPQPYKATHKVRLVTATALFDGHDASINIMRRILQSSGAEVIHLGHNRSAGEIVNAALQEDAQAIAITSYQGGHNEFFRYIVDLLRENGGENIKVYGGGGGVIVPSEIKDLMAYGVTRLFSPEDGATLGLQGMIDDVIRGADYNVSDLAPKADQALTALRSGDRRQLARVISAIENGAYDEATRQAIREAAAELTVPSLGITGTGGAGKSSLTDELVLRLRLDQNDKPRVAVISIDPSRKRTGGALLGDRIRMNAIEHEHIYMRSLATRDTGSEISAALPDVMAACKLSGFDLIIVETSGIGQGDAAIVPFVDVSLYVMTPEFGAASQLEKIDMLDFADFIAINKYDRKGAEDALRDVRKQYQRNRERFMESPDAMPVFGTMAARFNDDGVTALYQALLPALVDKGFQPAPSALAPVAVKASSHRRAVVPPERVRYLAEIAGDVRDYHRTIEQQCQVVREREALALSRRLLGDDAAADRLATLEQAKDGELLPGPRRLLAEWPTVVEQYSGDAHVVKIRDKEIRTVLTTTSLSGSKVRKVALPRFEDAAERLRQQMMAGRRVAGLGRTLGEFCARTAFRGSDLSMQAPDKKADVALFSGNVELCDITENLVFTDPYFDAEMNRHTAPQLDGVVAELRRDEQLKIAAQHFKRAFTSRAETMCHGDLHTGSIMVTDDQARIIDPEFAFYGPMGFDAGMLIGNYLMACLAMPAHVADDAACTAYQDWLLDVVGETWATFAGEFSRLWHTERTGILYARTLYEDQGDHLASDAALREVLGEIFRDAMGFAGIEMHRRILGLAHIAEFDSIEDPDVRAPLEEKALRLGRTLVLSRAGFAGIDQVIATTRIAARGEAQ